MGPSWRVARKQFLPSPGGLTLLGAALGVLLIGLFVGLVMEFSAEPAQPRGSWSR